jgi:hypothetical protein
MVEITDSKIAMVAQQASDNFCCAVVVNMKITPAVWLIRTADRTSPVLFCQQRVIAAQWEAIAGLQRIVLSCARMLVTPFLRGFAHLRKMPATPVIVALARTLLAVNVKAADGVSAAVKLACVFGFPTSRATFEHNSFYVADTS